MSPHNMSSQKAVVVIIGCGFAGQRCVLIEPPRRQLFPDRELEHYNMGILLSLSTEDAIFVDQEMGHGTLSCGNAGHSACWKSTNGSLMSS